MGFEEVHRLLTVTLKWNSASNRSTGKTERGDNVTRFQWHPYTSQGTVVTPSRCQNPSPVTGRVPGGLIWYPPSSHRGPLVLCACVNEGCPSKALSSSLSCIWVTDLIRSEMQLGIVQNDFPKRGWRIKSLIKGTDVYGDHSITVSIETFVDLWLGRKALHLGHSFFFFSILILNKNLK